MNGRGYREFMGDVRRFRPAIVILVSIVVLLPSLDEMLTQALSPLSVLERFVEIVIVVGALVWGASSIVLRYARIQARHELSKDRESEYRS